MNEKEQLRLELERLEERRGEGEASDDKDEEVEQQGTEDVRHDDLTEVAVADLV